MEKDWIINWYCENQEPFYKYTVIGWIKDTNETFCWRVPSIDNERYDLSAANKITRNEMTYFLKYGTIVCCGG
jgi:hypothetical protein